ncbi:hypothetical protein amyaer_p04790 (plasmid) [Microcystis aeruginosa NIES-2481]|uniref:hypothetical protein n=1 Tax=Microcystis aeruginosa TaxID=1126 RepID=UPI000CA3576E|nr:hypothetical protein [Microcystis aeruginosa]AUS35917.1 hypothetical protein amyaer_p04790 [Microcystis aeruginosa NIES-2481]
MKRRKFIQYSTIGGGSFLLSLGLNNLPPAGAFIWGLIFRALLQAAFSGFQMRDQKWWDERLDVMLAQREFIRQRFTDVSVAEVESPQYNVLVAAQQTQSQSLIIDPKKNKNIPNKINGTITNNVAFACPRIENGEECLATFAGPAAVGMTIAATYLKQNERMSFDDVQASIIPKFQGNVQYSDMRGWSDSTAFRAYPNSYSDNGVRIRYDAIDPRPGGYGIIDVSVDSWHLIQIPKIRVDFV